MCHNWNYVVSLRPTRRWHYAAIRAAYTCDQELCAPSSGRTRNSVFQDHARGELQDAEDQLTRRDRRVGRYCRTTTPPSGRIRQPSLPEATPEEDGQDRLRSTHEKSQEVRDWEWGQLTYPSVGRNIVKRACTQLGSKRRPPMKKRLSQ